MSKLIRLQLGRQFSARMSLEEWVETGREIYSMAERLTWQLADWAAFGDVAINEGGILRPPNSDERPHGVLKKFCDNNPPLDYGTLTTYAWVASHVQSSIRIEHLTFSHHRAVAALPPPAQKKWLKQALAHSWSVAELRRQINQAAAGGVSIGGDGPVFHFPDKSAIELAKHLSSQPDGYWTDEMKKYWRPKIAPIVDVWNRRLTS